MRTATTYIRYKPLKPGVYRIRVTRWCILETPFGTSVVIRFERPKVKGWLRPPINVSVDAELRGGERPSQLYSWISALEFDGGPLPEGYSLETASLLLRKAWAVIDVAERDGVTHNRLVRLQPRRRWGYSTPQIPVDGGATISLGAMSGRPTSSKTGSSMTGRPGDGAGALLRRRR